MSVQIWRRILVDRIAIKVNIVSKSLYQSTLSQLYKMVVIRKEILPGGNIVVMPSKYCRRLEYCPEYHSKKDNRRITEIEVGSYVEAGTEKLKYYFKLTLYPSKFQEGEFERFKKTLGQMLPLFNYGKLYSTGKVTYLEVACDSLSHPKNSFIPYRKSASKSKVWIESNGDLGTTYLGSRTSGLRFAIYDKRKQLIAKGKQPLFATLPHTRIEARVRHLGISASELQGIENPFLKLRVADLTTAQGLSTEQDWQEFIDHSLAVGVPEALKTCPQKQKKYRATLDSLQVGWWNPANRWVDLAKALAVLSP